MVEMSKMPFRLGTRGSELAMLQTEEVVRMLKGAGLPDAIEIVRVRTSGDSKEAMRPLEGSFVHEINRLVLDEELDGGIHSMKDLPVSLPRGLAIEIVPPRGSRLDCMISRGYYTTLPPGSTIATASPRRLAQIRMARMDLEPVEMRGNVTTRLNRVREGKVDAVVLALSGMERIGFRGEKGMELHPLPLDKFVPAAGQGALALVTREGVVPEHVKRRVESRSARQEVSIERSVLEALGAGCNTPMGVSAVSLGKQFHLMIQLLSADGQFEKKISRVIRTVEDAAGLADEFSDERSKSIIRGGK